MKKVIILQFLILGTGIGFSFGQSTWERFYNYFYFTDGIRGTRGDIKYDSASDKYNFLGIDNEYRVAKYDISAQGDLLSWNYFGVDLMSTDQIIKFTKDKGMIVGGYDTLAPNTACETLYKIDSTNNIVWKHKYNWPGLTHGLIETIDSKFVLAWGVYDSINYPVIIKTDSAGKLLASRKYNINCLVRLVEQTADGNYLLAFNSNFMSGNGFILVKTDTSFSPLWSKSYLRPRGVIVDLIVKTNGNLLLAGITDTTFQTQYPKLYLMELDAFGNVLWTKTYGDLNYPMVVSNITYGFRFDPIKIYQTLDQGLVLITTMRFPGNNDLVLMKTDSMGNFEWERRYGDANYPELGVNLLQTPDSGFFVVGAFVRSPINMGYYLLKTDPLGYVGCTEVSDIIPVVSLLPTDSTIVITDSLFDPRENVTWVQDTVDVPPDSLTSCFPVKIKEFYKWYYSPIAYPNPTTGVFHLKMPEGVRGEKNIFIYDLAGREVSSTIHTFKTEFDFTLTAKGIYLVKVADAERTVVVKVVVM